MASKINECLNGVSGFGRKFRSLDPVKIHRFNYWIYVYSGLTSYQPPLRWKRIVYGMYKYATKMVYAISITFFAIDAILVRNDLDKLSFNLSSSVLVATKVTQFLHLSRYEDTFEDIFVKLDKNLELETVGTSEEDRAIFRNKAKVIRRLTIMFYSVLVFGFPLRILTDTLGVKGYLIPVPFKHFFDNYYEIVYVQQTITSFHFFFATLAYDLLGFSLFVRLIGHYEILEKNLLKIKSLYPKRNFEKYVRGYTENIDDGIKENVLIRKSNYPDKLQTLIKTNRLVQRTSLKWTDGEKRRDERTFELLKENLTHHQTLLEIVRTFSVFYSPPLLIQFCGMGILVGITALQILILSKDINLMVMQQLLYISMMFTNIFLLCSFGSELTSRSTLAMNALYDAPWYDMSMSNRNMVNLMLEKLAKGPVIKGGGMLTISRVTWVQFLQTSYNMVNLLRNKRF